MAKAKKAAAPTKKVVAKKIKAPVTAAPVMVAPRPAPIETAPLAPAPAPIETGENPASHECTAIARKAIASNPGKVRELLPDVADVDMFDVLHAKLHYGSIRANDLI